MTEFNAKEYSKKYREKNRKKLRKVALSHHYKRKKVLAEIRKKRHAKFHINESVGTSNRQRNWTFGKAEFELVCGCNI